MKYPIGIQNFREIRTGGYVYVDKTPHIHRILDSGKYFFLSRPRRFGKSLLLSTMNELYCGAKELFKGLWIHDQWDWETKKRPVVWLKFATFQYKNYSLQEAIFAGLALEAERLGVPPADGMAHPLLDLLQKVNQQYGQKAVLLIDEYDKPIIDFLDDIPRAETNRDALKWLYSVLKDSDPLLEAVFITGVSAFGKVSIFSDLNNLRNLTLEPEAYTLLGITQEELETTFAEPMTQFDKAKVKDWYNGYSWGGDKVYNPFSLLNFLQGGRFANYWHDTGTPTFLVKAIRKSGRYNLSGTVQAALDLGNFELDNLNPLAVLFQTGYLTITEYEPDDFAYTLGYPNREVRFALEQLLLNEYLEDPLRGGLPRVLTLRDALRKKDIEAVANILNATFAGIPAEHWQKENEHFYHALIHLTFSLLGTYVKSEVHTANGRCDALVETADYIYAFEFKLDKPAKAALQQIHDKGYLTPYADSPKEKIAIGISFSKAQKSVQEWLVEMV